MTRAEQAQQMQGFVRSGAELIDLRAKMFANWKQQVASNGYAISPECNKALSQCQAVLEKASKELLKVVVELEPYTLHVPDGSYAEIG